MTTTQIGLIVSLLGLSVLLWLIPALAWVACRLTTKPCYEAGKRSGISRILMISACLIGSVWCLRYAVGYYGILVAAPGEATLTWYEEIFNSLVHALQTFSMDEDYTAYILDGKTMLADMFGAGTVWLTVYGLYASLLNFIAPIAGGAVILEIIASIFPTIRLWLVRGAFWRPKYYFSELNESSLELARNIRSAGGSVLRRPILVFTDIFSDDSEQHAELLGAAKLLGAICVHDDLAHVKKNRFGGRSFFLVDVPETRNLQILPKLADDLNSRYLKNAEVYFFTTDDAYVPIEKNIRAKLKDDLGFAESELPIFVPVRYYAHMVRNLLADLPLYEPLIGMKQAEDERELTVTVLGTGLIGTEMFLSTYWFGQMLDCRLTIHVISEESEQSFWSRIDYINPEIRRTVLETEDSQSKQAARKETLKITRDGKRLSPAYCKVRYSECDVTSSDFLNVLNETEWGASRADYFLVSLGTDEKNISVANTLRRHLGQAHIAVAASAEKADEQTAGRAVITYVVYDHGLASTLNREHRFSYVDRTADIYMAAVGSLRDVCSVRNIFMNEYDYMRENYAEAYRLIRDRETRKHAYEKRMKDEYNFWANIARGMHLKYRIFSAGFFEHSLFDLEGSHEGEAYREELRAASRRYRAWLSGEDGEDHRPLLHRMSWLEHRRWNAFMRVQGFCHSDDYDTYAAMTGSYKHMELKMHPCLVECDANGIRATISTTGEIDESTRFLCADRSDFDLLDELTYDLHDKGLNSYDFKQYDYPSSDLRSL